jgi:hypothetical protein
MLENIETVIKVLLKERLWLMVCAQSDRAGQKVVL